MHLQCSPLCFAGRAHRNNNRKEQTINRQHSKPSFNALVCNKTREKKKHQKGFNKSSIMNAQVRGKAQSAIYNSTVCNSHTLTEQHAVALSAGLSPLRSVSNTFIFSTRQQRAVSVASPTFSYTPFAWNTRT